MIYHFLSSHQLAILSVMQNHVSRACLTYLTHVSLFWDQCNVDQKAAKCLNWPIEPSDERADVYFAFFGIYKFVVSVLISLAADQFWKTINFGLINLLLIWQNSCYVFPTGL